RKTGAKVRAKLRKWYVKYKDADGIIRRVPGYSNKEATKALAVELERQAARIATGLADPTEAQRKRPLADHLAEWHADLTARGNTAKHADLSRTRARVVIEAAGAVRIGDLTPSA